MLSRPPGEEWLVAGLQSSAALDYFSAADWAASGEAGKTFEFKRELAEFAGVLGTLVGDALASIQDRSDHPVLCLPLGSAALFALNLVHWSRPNVRSPLVLTLGPLSDGTADAVSAASAQPSEVVILAGAAAIEGSGGVRIEHDVDAISSSGIDTRVLDTAMSDWNAALRGADALHYAGHLVPMGPDDTALTLSTGSRLPVAEIHRLSLRHLQCATLIACYTGLGRHEAAAEQVEHVAGAFLEAGVPAVVGTLWPVFDKPSQLFTQAFYSALAERRGIAESFRMGVEAIRTHRMAGLAIYAPAPAKSVNHVRSSWVATRQPSRGARHRSRRGRESSPS